MGILEKLRPTPRWKHPDPSVRATAVYEIGPDDGDALRALAREDADARVRRAAVTRLERLRKILRAGGYQCRLAGKGRLRDDAAGHRLLLSALLLLPALFLGAALLLRSTLLLRHLASSTSGW